ncbi:dicarboxylate/amino acid:cation symporter [Pleionea sediminis]|uniref:dicarboxylate/amino acid:cation symporter n=1 Tax=Pleionea sediminis TaxID=2569479 RepID=UPI0011854596|nr:dicarboxylate/amino acid:cation symporter [Pleionea sediminis]
MFNFRGHNQSSLFSSKALLDRLGFLLRAKLWAQILVGMFLGIFIGLLLSPSGGALINETHALLASEWLALPGRIFLAMIQMIVVPLVIASIVLGITSSGDGEFVKKAGYRIAPYFVSTTIVAVLIGFGVAVLIEPGAFLNQELIRKTLSDEGVNLALASSQTLDAVSVPQRIVELIPSNPTQTIADRAMFQIVILAIIMALAVLAIPRDKSRPVLELLSSLQEIAMKVVAWAMLLAPFAVFGLMAEISIKVGVDAILGMGVYIATVLSGLILLLIFYLLMAFFVSQKRPLEFLSAIREAQLLAFSTSSSAAVMPLSIKTAQDNLKVDPQVAKIIIPLGATINMDGTALYQVVAAVFLTQVFGIDLSGTQFFLLVVTTVGASIGAPSTPGVGIVVLASILTSIGVPATGIALIIGVDRILDMCRTTLNVTGDLTACVVMHRWLGN